MSHKQPEEDKAEGTINKSKREVQKHKPVLKKLIFYVEVNL